MVDPVKSKRRWFRVLAVCLALLPFLVLEFSLRYSQSGTLADSAVDLDPLVTFSQTHPLFVRDEDQGDWVTSPERHNFFRPARFAIDKPQGSRRVFVVGGSTVQGRPYAHETAFSTWLQLRLQARDPQTQCEMVNVGGVSYASYRVAILVDEILKHQPDVIVLYTGHNEFLENRSYAGVSGLSATQTFASRLGSKLHTVRWIQRRFAASTEPVVLPGEVDAALDHPDGLKSYQRDRVWRQQIQDHFAITFRRIVRRIRQHGVKLIVCLPASDLIGTPPIKTTSATLNETEQEDFQRQYAIARDDDAKMETRIQACREALSIDPQHSGIHYLLGRLLLERGESSAAREHLVSARDHDVCPLRATTTIEQHVESIANANQVALIRTSELLDERNHRGDRIPDGIADADFFVDHVHPSIAGHQLIARAIADQLLEKTDQSEERYERLADQHMKSLGEDYFIRGKQRLAGLRRWATGRAGQLGLETELETETGEQ